jgi:hypothetical protein
VAEEIILKEEETHHECFHEACDTCLVGKPLLEKYRQSPMEGVLVSYTKWDHNAQGRLVQVTTDMAVAEAVDEVAAQVKRFVHHHQIKRIQSEAYKMDKVASSSEMVMLQMDFAQSYGCDFQDEVQSAYYNKKQITVFTCCVWKGLQEKRNIVILSDCLEHNRKSVSVFLAELLKLLMTPEVRTVIYK